MRILAVLLLLAGCSNMPNSTDLASAVKDKNGVAACGTFTGVGGQGRAVVVNLDEVKGINGTITVAPDCSITVNTSTTYKSAVQPPIPVAKP